MKKKVILSVVSAVAGSFLTMGVASAGMLTGGISFNGYNWAPILAPLPDGSNEVVGIDFNPNEGITGSGTGDFVLLEGLSMQNQDITFTPFVALTPLWEIFAANGTYSFDLNEVTVLSKLPNFIALSGVGTLNGPGFDPTAGTWLLTANSVGLLENATFSWSSSTGATGGEVPEPATMILFGTGLVGLAGMARKRKAAHNQVAN